MMPPVSRVASICLDCSCMNLEFVIEFVGNIENIHPIISACSVVYKIRKHLY